MRDISQSFIPAYQSYTGSSCAKTIFFLTHPGQITNICVSYLMACRQFGAKSFPETMLAHCCLNTCQEQTLRKWHLIGFMPEKYFKIAVWEWRPLCARLNILMIIKCAVCWVTYEGSRIYGYGKTCDHSRTRGVVRFGPSGNLCWNTCGLRLF